MPQLFHVRSFPCRLKITKTRIQQFIQTYIRVTRQRSYCSGTTQEHEIDINPTTATTDESTEATIMDQAEQPFEIETATLSATRDPDRSSKYKEATTQDSDDDSDDDHQNENEGETEKTEEKEEREGPRKARKFFAAGTAVMLAVGGFGMLGKKLLLDDDDDDDAAAIVEHGTGNTPCPQPTSEMAVVQAPPPPPAPPSQVLQQMACQAAANAAGAVGAGAAGAAGAAAAAAGIMGVVAA